MLFVIIAATILPGILGCCFPDKFSGSNYAVEQKVLSTYVMDFSQGKLIIKPVAGPVEFVLSDFGNNKTYTKTKDGNCTKSDLAESDAYTQCLPTNALSADFNLGPLGALPITSSRFTVGSIQFAVAATKSDCLPVITIRSEGKKTTTSIFANTTSTNVNVADLNQDISNCF